MLKTLFQNRLFIFAILVISGLPVAGGVESHNANEEKTSNANVSSESNTAIINSKSEPKHLFSKDQSDSIFSKEVGVKEDKSGIQYKTDSSITGFYLLKILVSLLFVLGLAYVVALYLKKIKPGWFVGAVQNSKHIHVIEQKRITPRLSVYLLDVNDTKIILAQSGDNVSFFPASVHFDTDSRAVPVTDQFHSND